MEGRPDVDITGVGPRLYIGSAPPYGALLRAMGIDMLVLCAQEHQPASLLFREIEVVYAPLDDDKRFPTEVEWSVATDAARKAAEAIKAGRTVLVTCWMGKNRSALVTALTLHMLTGWSGRDIIKHIKKVRPQALTNDYFVRILSKVRANKKRK